MREQDQFPFARESPRSVSVKQSRALVETKHCKADLRHGKFHPKSWSCSSTNVSLGWPQIEWLSKGYTAEVLGRDTVRRIKSPAKTKLQLNSKEGLGSLGSHDLCTPSILAAFANFFPVPERYTINGMCSCMAIAASTNTFEPGTMVNSRVYF
jgi:hypothetical protein